MDAQFWLVAISNTVHLMATVVWIGWSLLLPLVVAPRAVEAHGDDGGWASWLTRRAPPLAYGALAALWATGMLQMSAHPQYEGMFAVTNPWGALLLAKHLVILGSIGVIALLGHTVSPRLRLAIRRAALGKENDSALLTARFRTLAWLNAALGLVVLALTGAMTAIR
jgi:uncharacterized membrane protein